MRFVSGEYFTGKQQMFVQRSNNDEVAKTPTKDPADFSFHSDFTYYDYIGEATGSVTFRGYSRSTRTVDYGSKDFLGIDLGKDAGSETFSVPKTYTQTKSQSLGVQVPPDGIVSIVDAADNSPIPGFYLGQSSGGAFRLVTVSVAGDRLVWRSQANTFSSGIGSLTINYRVLVFGLSITEGSDPGMLLRLEPGRVTFGQGKFDTSVPYLTQDPQGGAVFLEGTTVEFSSGVGGVGIRYALDGPGAAFGPSAPEPSARIVRAQPR